MAQCKVCQKKGFMIETDFNGLCLDCAPYYYVSSQEDLKALQQALAALERIDYPAAAQSRLKVAREKLEALRPYALAKLIKLPRSLDSIEQELETLEKQWQEE